RVPNARIALKVLESRGLVRCVAMPSLANGTASLEGATHQPAYQLTPEQQAAVEAIAKPLEERRYEAFLLHGVTGSGKTEVYMRLAARAIAMGRTAIVMVPEIALADELVRSFRERFAALVAIAHSAQSVSERWASWMAALTGEARIMIGPRSLIFAPLHD